MFLIRSILKGSDALNEGNVFLILSGYTFHNALSIYVATITSLLKLYR